MRKKYMGLLPIFSVGFLSGKNYPDLYGWIAGFKLTHPKLPGNDHQDGYQLEDRGATKGC